MGIFLLISDGFRTYQEQSTLYNNYIAGIGGIAAPPGSSWHEYRRAFDVMPINSDGSNGFGNMNFNLWQIIHGYAEQIGLCHGHSFQDDSHFWYTGGSCNITLSQWRNSNNIPHSSTEEFNNTIAPPKTQTAGFTSWFMIAALIGLFVSEDFRKK